jgi:hypothetical protein
LLEQEKFGEELLDHPQLRGGLTADDLPSLAPADAMIVKGFMCPLVDILCTMMKGALA